MYRQWQILTTATIIGLYALLEFYFDHEHISLIALAVPLVVLLGIPHGATDYLLHKFFQKRADDGNSLWHFVLKYLLFVLGYGVFWVFSPVFSLIVFLLISAYHFGETHWQRTTFYLAAFRYDKLVFLLWGISLLCTLFMLYPDATVFYLQGILHDSDVFIFHTTLRITGIFALASWIGMAYFSVSKKDFFRQILEYSLLTVIFYLTDLLIGFTIFFTIWHSWDAIGLQMDGIRKKYPNFNIRTFAKAAFPFTAISLIGMAGVILFFQTIPTDLSPITVFLILIALVTLPHQFEVTRFYEQVRIKE